MATPSDFINALQYEWMQRTLISAILIGIICALIGVFIIMRGMIFLGEAIAHSAFAGAALALLLGFQDPLLVIFIFGVSVALIIGFVEEKDEMNNDIIIGIIFAGFMALAIFFIGLLPSYSSSVQAILFGRILLITKRNLQLLWIFSFVIIGTIMLFKKEMFFFSFDRDLAQLSGIPIKALNFIFLILIAMAIDVSITAIGAILVFALLLIPAATAYQLTYNINRLLLLASLFGVLASVGGLFLSFLYDWPSGSIIVLLATTFFVISFVISPKRDRPILALSRRIWTWTTTPQKSPPIEFPSLPHFHGSEKDLEDFKNHLRATTQTKRIYKERDAHEE